MSRVFCLYIISGSYNINNLKKYGIQYIPIDFKDIKILYEVMEPLLNKKIDSLINFTRIIETGAMIDSPYKKCDSQ